jgi:glycosyltransferase involved in cell wall biosynthesis
MQKKILIFSGYFHPHKGGSEEYILKLCRFLISKGIECHVVTCNTEHVAEEENVEGIKIFRVPSWHFVGKKYPVPVPWSMLRFFHRLKRNSYDYIFTNTRFFNICFYAPLFKKWHNKNAKLVHLEHGTKHTDDEAFFVRMINIVYDKMIGRFIMKSADQIFAISGEQSKAFVKKLSGKTAKIAYNSIEVKAFVKKQTSLKRTLGIKNEIVVSYAGRLIEAKGVQDLIDACRNLKVKLIILGSGSFEDALKKQARNMKNVVFINKAFDQNLLLEVFSITDIFVNPSYNEGMPTLVLEAGAFGLPIIATSVGSTYEIIDNNVNGFLVAPKNVDQLKQNIEALMKNKSLRAKFAENLKIKIKKKFDVNTAFMPILRYIKQ